MDALLQLNANSSIDESRFAAQREKMKRAEKSGVSFNDELDAAKSSDAVKSENATRKERAKKKLWDACIETESLFVGQMLKQMRNTIHKGEILNGGQTEEIFTDMLYDRYSLELSKNSNLGIAKQMYSQLSKNM